MNTQLILKADDVSGGELPGLLAALAPPAGETLRVWLEAPDGWALAYWPGVDGKVPWCRAAHEPVQASAREVLGCATSGRIFGPTGELRWRVLPALGEKSCRVVFLGHLDWLPSRLEPAHDLPKLTPKPRQYLLWGQWVRDSDPTAPEWVEFRIPHRFRYPVEPAPDERHPGVCAVLEAWCDARGEPHFLRLCDLRRYSPDQPEK